ncbi:MAG: hypothetical protein QW244_03315 [Candidatus Pacearchaeota archaeon]
MVKKNARNKVIVKSVLKGILASIILLAFFFLIFTWVSGITFALNQLMLLWPFVFALSFGFGLQFGLYSFLKDALKIKNIVAKTTVTGSGVISTGSMAACCAHFIPSLIPILGLSIAPGLSGVLIESMRYQKLFFSIGIIANIIGIITMVRMIKTRPK